MNEYEIGFETVLARRSGSFFRHFKNEFLARLFVDEYNMKPSRCHEYWFIGERITEIWKEEEDEEEQDWNPS